MSKRKERQGDSIPGSVLYRAFCCRCDEPIRVTWSDLQKQKQFWCHDCDPKPQPSTAATKDDISPWQENAIRCMEDC